MKNEKLKAEAREYPEIEMRAHEISLEIMRRIELPEIDPQEFPELYPDEVTDAYLKAYDIVHGQVFGHLFSNSDAPRLRAEKIKEDEKYSHEYVVPTIQ